MGASHLPARGHRKQFTKEDDEILLEWVHKSERSGLATAGMKMYEALAQEVRYPQGTAWCSQVLTIAASATYFPVMEKPLRKELSWTETSCGTICRDSTCFHV